MAEYIERRQAIKLVYDARRSPPIKGVLTDTMSWAIAVVNDIPAADVQPKKEGKWLTEVLDGPPGMRPLVFVCSMCWHVSNVETRYCCNCGARMDGDGNG